MQNKYSGLVKLNLIPTILCGGAGSRLWPISREQNPKPFIKLPDGESLLQKAFLRAASLANTKHIITVTNKELLFRTVEEFDSINARNIETSFILEPIGKNTAAAIAIATIQVMKRFGHDAIMLVLAADHLISKKASFELAVDAACKLAIDQKLVTFGIKPDYPETGYGYIEGNGNNVIRFVEKPSKEKAEEYVSKENYYWNSGIFCFQAGAMLSEMEKHCPEILKHAQTSYSAAIIDDEKIELTLEEFSKIPENSIDYAVMESSKNIAVIPCEIGWSDIGSWNALAELIESDPSGNRIDGEAIVHNTKNCVIQSENRLIATVGVEDLVIIDTADALLVAKKDNSQDVKHIVSNLKKQDHDAHKVHNTVQRPWGSYTVLGDGENFKLKRIEVKPGASLSLQLHHHRSEHWIVVRGMARVVNGDKEFFVRTNESTYIPAGQQHRLENPGILDLVMIEVQTGNYLGEDDIVRLQDKYGRA
ncbi:mannose-1-phosphate guanylyltransferase/mannose-6-phosphate isomerase [Chromobacterium violaceum]|uniref:mannose-1-phosphate guanylyltransferase/mannose-6-phosphate isomerase n=1 Tax=Chromobacterium violaceum TaxID=536 RepID=UPI001B325A8E|nr:mannose-1-phosphate guanylyltransferase/mannose-6-phosphate isomerase [Chromobacterium violaceum]MBP4044676.1 mannose-1-phosphate guanylyltransferase/mannose-6-phosphate isomerase [Chromobacterium violaceum]